ncbi:hypothetical protein EIKCOROL_01135 [Eikenella corrodens ATCC 23834]|uniref:Uncharacterized protein n=1 Tax=Eikenella corrodens ATCC 23834 TaxID=546274 RepID=C0DUU7_EIKCO|nr:hypothetical protein EIKCOROL_01135 [Eikenella corrodens ATCC 23834]
MAHEAEHAFGLVMRLAQIDIEHAEAGGRQDLLQCSTGYGIAPGEAAIHEHVGFGHARKRCFGCADFIPGAGVNDVVAGAAVGLEQHFHQAGGVFFIGLHQIGGHVARRNLAQQLFAVGIAAAPADDAAVRAKRGQTHQNIERRAAEGFAAGEVVPQYFAEAADFHDEAFMVVYLGVGSLPDFGFR